MRRLFPLLAALLPLPAAAQSPGDAWWRHVEVLASDGMEGRLAGSPGYMRAADYVVGRFKAAGLRPAGTRGYLQPVRFVSQTIDRTRTRVSLVRDGVATRLATPEDIVVSPRGGPAPVTIDAPLVFIGYGLHMPEAGHDDLAGIELKGRIAVTISGGPADVSGAIKSHARSSLPSLLEARGAIGLITLTTDKQREAPWAVAAGRAGQPAMYLAEPALRDLAKPFFSAALGPQRMAALFAAASLSYAEIAALADASRAVPRMNLNQSLRATIVADRSGSVSPNIVGLLPGSDAKLRRDHVVVSAHLDGLGIGKEVRGDRIYNGALDNAAGVASLIEIAQALGKGPRPRRSILFVALTSEEQGLLGSRAFAHSPSVPGRIVANLNFDMPLPLYPLKSVIALGAQESSLGRDAAAIGAEMGLPLGDDPFPDRNSFTRSDQYSFIREGVPALAFKFGFAAATPEAERERRWRAERYHLPFDDLAQPNVEKDDQARLNDFVARLTRRVADAPARPEWLPTSFFARFAK